MKLFKHAYAAFLSLALLLVVSGQGQAFNSISECLIVNDIGIFTYKDNASHMGNGAGVVGATGHFKDHIDKVCEGSYSNINEIRGLPIEEARKKVMGVHIQVTQHAGADSDQWLLHEIDEQFRDDDFEALGQLVYGTVMREIDGNKLFKISIGGGHYLWLSGNKVVDIRYTDLQLTKPRPLEVVKAYLAKHPSTITMADEELKGDAHNKKWIKDEMERRLWLCGKWYMQVQLEKATQDGIARDVHKHLETFVNYREKYFEIDGKADREALAAYLYARNHTALKSKYEDLQKWWQDNKDKDITLP